MKTSALAHLAAACAVLLAIPAGAETIPVTRLIVWGDNGESVAYRLTENPSVKFDDDEVAITTGGETEVRLPLSALSRITYDTIDVNITTGLPVESLIADGDTDGTEDDGNIVFTLREGDNAIEIVNLRGEVLVDTHIHGNGERIYPLTGMQPGVYIVKFNGVTHKIVKR